MLASLSLLLIHLPPLLAAAPKPFSLSALLSDSKQPLQFASPLQSFTIFDSYPASPRSRFLPRLRAGLAAERRARLEIRDLPLTVDNNNNNNNWAEQSAMGEKQREQEVERRLEQAYDEAVKVWDSQQTTPEKQWKERRNSHQLVGVIHDNGTVWYARKKPKGALWSVRLVHVNRDAVLRDLFVKGKLDLYGQYTGEEGSEKQMFQGQYSLRERSWRTLWNFSPTRLFSTSSGSYWRERRLTPGLYTDGSLVYESVYRYRDGKNGMKPVAKWSDFLQSNGAGSEVRKKSIVERLKRGDVPDVVIEK